jgi:metallo-beta-lactamase family protein
MAYIQFLGAAGTVTGSKHLINLSGDATGKGLQVLVDCGLFQGPKEWRVRNWQDSPVPAPEIEAVILTHAHLDHSGWLPRLVKEGFRGPIYATPATVDLCGVLLPDSGHLQEEDAAFHNKHKSSTHDPALPLYTEQEALACQKYFKPVDFGVSVQISADFSFRFVRAAHILGSGFAEITAKINGQTRALLFTGDIGRVRDSVTAPGKVLYCGPTEGEAPDLLVMESTYGNRPHPTDDPRPQMAQLMKDAFARGGCVVIPAFAVERTQKIVFMLKNMMETGQIPKVPVHVDSPMAVQAVEIFLKHSEEFSPEAKDLIAKYGSPLQWPGYSFDIKVDESKKINSYKVPMVIISSSGMVNGGRIQHHLIQRLPDPRNLVLFIGFQAPGTAGYIIKSGAKTVKLFGQQVPIRAQIAALEQFSDHADTHELTEWLKTFKKQPAVTYLVHGEPTASAQLQKDLTAALGWKIEVAQYLQKVPIG